MFTAVISGLLQQPGGVLEISRLKTVSETRPWDGAAPGWPHAVPTTTGSSWAGGRVGWGSVLREWGWSTSSGTGCSYSGAAASPEALTPGWGGEFSFGSSRPCVGVRGQASPWVLNLMSRLFYSHRGLQSVSACSGHLLFDR